MRAQSAALGAAAAAALTSAAAAAPCTGTALIPDRVSGCERIVGEQSFSSIAAGNQHEPGPSAAEDALTAGDAVSDELVEADRLSYPQVKITNLQATMTSSRYVAGRIPTVPRTAPADELMMYAPDYLSVKSLPRLPQQKPIGVGLVTLPKPPAKVSDSPPAVGQPPKTPQ